MWGAGTSYNWETIQSYFSRLINEIYVETNYIVENYGVGGYGNIQELIVLLEKVGFKKIDYVIFFDGVNDSGHGYNELLEDNT